jgi:hypothetical protein
VQRRGTRSSPGHAALALVWLNHVGIALLKVAAERWLAPPFHLLVGLLFLPLLCANVTNDASS